MRARECGCMFRWYKICSACDWNILNECWSWSWNWSSECAWWEQSVSLPSPSIFYIVRVVLFPSFHFVLFGISVSIYSRRRFIVVARAAHRLLVLLCCVRFSSCSPLLACHASLCLIFSFSVRQFLSRLFYYHSLLLYSVLFSFCNALTLSDAPIQCLPFVDVHPIE